MIAPVSALDMNELRSDIFFCDIVNDSWNSL